MGRGGGRREEIEKSGSGLRRRIEGGRDRKEGSKDKSRRGKK